ncbi:MAG: hypothetical protein WC972_10250 [Trueperaceae bacterium]
MARIVLGNREGLLAIRQGRGVLEHLAEEWPDLHLTLRTIPKTASQESGPLLAALEANDIGIAVAQLDALPPALPEGVRLAAVLKRGEPRSAFAAKGRAQLDALPEGARLLVSTERDASFLAATQAAMEVEIDRSAPEALLARLGVGADAVILPAATLVTLGLRSAIDTLIDETVFTPAPGQGAIGLLVREDDDLAYETAYSLQHRPSFDRVRAELAFASELPGRNVGASATVNDEFELTLLGAVAEGSTILQATVSGEAREAEDLARELAKDVVEQLAGLG